MEVGKKDPKIKYLSSFVEEKSWKFKRHSEDSKTAILINTFFDAKLDKK